MTSVLVTGASGYIGGRLMEHLATAGRRAHALARNAFDDASQFEGVGSVVHLAGANEVDAATDPERALLDTVRATWRVTQAAAAAGVERLVYVSTVHVYGPPDESALLSENLLPAPHGSYAVARLASEHIIDAADIDAVVLRMTNSVGAPHNVAVRRWTLVANDLCRQAATTGTMRLRTDGSQWRDFVPMSDAVRILAATTDPAAVPAGTYNLGSGVPTTVRQLAELVGDAFEELTGERPLLEAPELRADPPKPYYVSVRRLADLGLYADGNLADAVAETARFCLEHASELGA